MSFGSLRKRRRPSLQGKRLSGATWPRFNASRGQRPPATGVAPRKILTAVWTSTFCSDNLASCSPEFTPPPCTGSMLMKWRSRSTPPAATPGSSSSVCPTRRSKKAGSRHDRDQQQRLLLAARAHDDQSRAGRHQKGRPELRSADRARDDRRRAGNRGRSLC